MDLANAVAPKHTLVCFLCKKVVSFLNGDNNKFDKHMKKIHNAYFNLSAMLAVNFLDNDSISEIVFQFKENLKMIKRANERPITKKDEPPPTIEDEDPLAFNGIESGELVSNVNNVNDINSSRDDEDDNENVAERDMPSSDSRNTNLEPPSKTRNAEISTEFSATSRIPNINLFGDNGWESDSESEDSAASKIPAIIQKNESEKFINGSGTEFKYSDTSKLLANIDAKVISCTANQTNAKKAPAPASRTIISENMETNQSEMFLKKKEISSIMNKEDMVYVRGETTTDPTATFSNDTRDACKTVCQICHKTMPVERMRSHTKQQHNVRITEYKEKYGPDFQLIEKVFHQCGICKVAILLDSDTIAHHLNKRGHNITHGNYNARFMVTRNGNRRSSI